MFPVNHPDHMPAVGSDKEPPPPDIPNYEMLHRIGRGGYGDVWLARTVIGEYRAVKILHRERFEDHHPYEREFEGIRKFEPISRSHPGLVNLFHIGRNDAAGFFHYVMELADDANGAGPTAANCSSSPECTNPFPGRTEPQALDPTRYAPRTLRFDLRRHRRLPFEECLRVGLALTAGLEHLHAHGLVHRDIKPSNVIFVNGLPKLADIGLVAAAGERQSLVGTEGFAAPEGPGTPQADLFSLGKVLYELSTGKPSQHFPEPLTKVAELPEHRQMQELNEVILKACHPNPEKRYASAGEMLADLVLVQAGKSVRRLRMLERGRKWAISTVVLSLLVAGSIWGWQLNREAWQREQERTRQREVLLRSARDLWKDERSAGWSAKAMEMLQQAGRIRVDDELREQVVATLGELEVRRLKVFTNFGATHIAFDSTGGRVVMDGMEGQSAKVWEVSTDELRHLPSTNAGPVWFTRDGGIRQFVHRGGGRFALLDVETGRILRELPYPFEAPGENFGPAILAATPDGSRCAAALTGSRGQEGSFAVWESVSGTVLAQGKEVCTAIAFSPEGLFLATGDGQGGVCVFGGANFSRIDRFQVGEVKVAGLCFQASLSPGEGSFAGAAPGLLAVGDAGGNIHLRNVQGKFIQAVCRGSDYEVCALAFSPDGMLLASGGRAELRLWDPATGRLLLKQFGWDQAMCLEFSPDSRRLAFGTKRGFEPAEAAVFEVEQNGEILRLRGLSSRCVGVRFSPSGRWLAAIAQNWEVGVWDLAASRLRWRLRTPKGITADNAAFSFSQDDRRLAFATSGRAVLWDLETGQEVRSWPLRTGLGQQICFDPANRLILFQWEFNQTDPLDGSKGGYCTTRRLLDPENAGASDPIIFRPFERRLLNAALSHDGRFVVVCGVGPSWDLAKPDHILKAFDCETGGEISEMISQDWHKNSDLHLDVSSRFLIHFSRKTQRSHVHGVPEGTALHSYPFPVIGSSSKLDWLIHGLDRQEQTIALRWGKDQTRSLVLGPGCKPQFSRDERKLAWGSGDGTVYLCDFPDLIATVQTLGFGW